jgi:phage protein D
MQVTYEIKVGGTTFTESNQRYISEIVVTDEAGVMSDTLHIVFSDTENTLELPRLGVKATVKVGFDGKLVNFGTYTVDSVEWDLDGKLVVSGKGWDSGSGSGSGSGEGGRVSLKTIRNICRIRTKLSDLVEDIAKANGLKARVSAAVKDKEVDPYQLNEPDLGYLQRITKSVGATLKLNGEFIVVTDKGSSISASGKKIEKVTFQRTDLSSLRYRSDKSEEEKEHKAFWADYKFGKVESSGDKGAAGGVSPKELPLLFSSEARASAAVAAEKKKAKHREFNLTLSIPGNERIGSETPVEIVGVKKGIDGIWTTERVEHSITAQTYTTTIECYRG